MSRYATTSSSRASRSDDRYYDRSRNTTTTTSSNSSSSNTAHHNFSLSDSDFQRDAVLQRQRYLSSERTSTSAAAPHASPSSSSHRSNTDNRTRDRSRDRDSRSYHQHQQSRTAPSASSAQQPPHRTWSGSSGTRQPHYPPPPSVSATAAAAAKAVAARAVATAAAAASADSAAPQPVASRLRSKSKSRARAMAPPKPKSSEFIALGQRAHTTNSYKATYYGSDKCRPTTRSRSRSVGSTVASKTPAAAPALATTSRSSESAAAAPQTSRTTTNDGDAEERGRARERDRERARERERELEREREALPAPRVALAKSSGSKSSRGAAAEAKARSKSSARNRKTRRSCSSSSSSSSSDDDARRKAARNRSKSWTRKASAKRTARSSSDSPSPDRTKSRRSKSKSKVRRTDLDARSRGKSKTRARTTTATVTTTGSSGIDADIASTKAKLHAATSELQQLEDEMRALQQRMDAKKYQIKHLELDLEVVEKRKRIELEYSSGSAAALGATASAPTSTSASSRDRHARSVSRARAGSKRPCIVDTDESSDDDDGVVILDPVQVKQEKSQKRQRSSSKPQTSASTSSRAKPSAPALVPVAMDTSLMEGLERTTEIPDHFWGKADTPKLLAQHRVRTMPDGHVRKGRHLAFNPMKSDYFATSSDDGGLIMWSYERPTHEIAKMGSFSPTSFRRENQCAESIVWSPDGNRLAMAFRDPIDGRGEFCVVLLHNLALTGSDRPQDIPSDRVTSMSTTLHSRGISAIEWIPTGYGAATTSRSLVTAGSDHAVILWEEHDDARKETDYKWKVLHREHRSEVKAICVHSQRQAIYTGGFDGQVIRYDMHKYTTSTVLERRKPTISKINAVLEHPHNPHVLLVSCVEASEHSILLYDLREPYSSYRDSTMTLSWVKSSDSKSMSQYIVPRWSPAGMHVSCGSKSGLVNIWDVRVRGSSFPVVLPQQSIAVHQKSVLHATWHPRYNALFSVSNDRTLGLLTFRDSDVSPPPREHEPLIEFFLTEMEKYQTMTTKLSLAHTKLQQELYEHEQALQRFQSDQSLRMHKYLEIMRRMEKEFVHGEQLRGEEKQLAVAQSKKRVDAMKRTVNEQLAALRAQGDQHRSELEDKLEKKFVDVVVENQTLRAENMELRGDLQHVSALVRSNKKTIRTLTEEILKIKRTAVVYPTDVDELLAFQSVKMRGDLSAFATAAAVHPTKPYQAS